jgi:hypothetical protein
VDLVTTLGRVLSGAYKLVPGATGPGGTVTYKQQNTGSGVTVDGCRRRPIHAYEKAMGGPFLNASDAVWFVPAATLGSIVPKPGDSITSGTTFWIIEHVESGLEQADYKCFGIQNR